MTPEENKTLQSLLESSDSESKLLGLTILRERYDKLYDNLIEEIKNPTTEGCSLKEIIYHLRYPLRKLTEENANLSKETAMVMEKFLTAEFARLDDKDHEDLFYNYKLH